MLTFSSKPAAPRSRRPAANGPGAGLAPLSAQSPQAIPTPRLMSAPADEPVESDWADDTVTPKGWHDSSNELRRGLEVTENVPLDALPPEWLAPPPRRR